MKNQNQHIVLRSATIDDLPTLERWDEQEHVIASDPNDDWNWEEELRRNPEWREQLIAELTNTPIGFIQIIDPKQEDTHYWGEIATGHKAIDIWIGENENLGKGYGAKMMQLALQRCFEDEETHTVLIDPLVSNTDAIRFYERIGFTFVEQRTFDEDECMVYKMTREDWEELV